MDEYDIFIEQNAQFLKKHMEDQKWGIQVQHDVTRKIQEMIDEEDGYCYEILDD